MVGLRIEIQTAGAFLARGVAALRLIGPRVHYPIAQKAGIAKDIADAIADGRRPTGDERR
jgi:hypothetical protein